MAPANQSFLSALSGPPQEFWIATCSAGQRESEYQMLLSKRVWSWEGVGGRRTPPVGSAEVEDWRRGVVIVALVW